MLRSGCLIPGFGSVQYHFQIQLLCLAGAPCIPLLLLNQLERIYLVTGELAVTIGIDLAESFVCTQIFGEQEF